MPASVDPVAITVGDGGARVSGLLMRPPDARWLYVLAHGAGAGMRHPFLETIARALAERDVATLRYQFPYMERRASRPDPPALAAAAVRGAVAEAARLAPGLLLVAGGKSFGGRMTSTAQAEEPLGTEVGIVIEGEGRIAVVAVGARGEALAGQMASKRDQLVLPGRRLEVHRGARHAKLQFAPISPAPRPKFKLGRGPPATRTISPGALPLKLK